MQEEDQPEGKVIYLYEHRDWRQPLYRLLLVYGWPPDKAAQVVMFAEFLTGLRKRGDEK